MGIRHWRDTSVLLWPHTPATKHAARTHLRVFTHSLLSLDSGSHIHPCLVNSRSSFRAQLQVLWGKFHRPSTSTHYPLCLHTLPASLRLAGLSLPVKRSHSTLYFAFIALSTAVVHQLFVKIFFNASFSSSKDHTAEDQIFLILCRISTTFYDAWLVLSWQQSLLKKSWMIREKYAIIWDSTPPGLMFCWFSAFRNFLCIQQIINNSSYFFGAFYLSMAVLSVLHSHKIPVS